MSLTKRSVGINPSLASMFYPQNFQIKESLELRKLPANVDIDSYLTNIIRDKIGNKCIDIGFVDKNSIKILSRSIGKINTSHFNGEIYYNLKVEGSICKPGEGNKIKCRVIGKNKIGLFAVNGPLQIVVSSAHHEDTSFLDKLEKDNEIIVEIVNYKFQLNDDNIKVIAKFVRKS